MADTLRDAADAILRSAEAILQSEQRILIAIDGRCAAGKTTLAAHLKRICVHCNVIHMDHFFLRQEQRTAARLNEPGGNVDYERFLNEVLLPLKRGEMFSYRPYDCGRGELASAISVEPCAVNIIEGSYSCHPVLREHYDLRIFLDADEGERMRRIINRNGEQGAAIFREKWIPLEERYFSMCQTEKNCDLKFKSLSI